MTDSNHIPANYHSVTPYMSFKNTDAAIDFYKKAFGAVEKFRLKDPDGKIGHAEIMIGNSHIMLSDEYPDFGSVSVQTVGGSPIKLHICVDDVDAFVSRAVEAGATILRPVQDKFYGERVGMLADPFGYSWFVATLVEEVSPEEMQRRWNAAFKTK